METPSIISSLRNRTVLTEDDRTITDDNIDPEDPGKFVGHNASIAYYPEAKIFFVLRRETRIRPFFTEFADYGGGTITDKVVPGNSYAGCQGDSRFPPETPGANFWWGNWDKVKDQTTLWMTDHPEASERYVKLLTLSPEFADGRICIAKFKKDDYLVAHGGRLERITFYRIIPSRDAPPNLVETWTFELSRLRSIYEKEVLIKRGRIDEIAIAGASAPDIASLAQVYGNRAESKFNKSSSRGLSDVALEEHIRKIYPGRPHANISLYKVFIEGGPGNFTIRLLFFNWFYKEGIATEEFTFKAEPPHDGDFVKPYGGQAWRYADVNWLQCDDGGGTDAFFHYRKDYVLNGLNFDGMSNVFIEDVKETGHIPLLSFSSAFVEIEPGLRIGVGHSKIKLAPGYDKYRGAMGPFKDSIMDIAGFYNYGKAGVNSRFKIHNGTVADPKKRTCLGYIYMMYFIVVQEDKRGNIIRMSISDSFLPLCVDCNFFKFALIFPTGLALKGNTVYISAGEGDFYTTIVEVNIGQFLELCRYDVNTLVNGGAFGGYSYHMVVTNYDGTLNKVATNGEVGDFLGDIERNMNVVKNQADLVQYATLDDEIGEIDPKVLEKLSVKDRPIKQIKFSIEAMNDHINEWSLAQKIKPEDSVFIGKIAKVFYDFKILTSWENLGAFLVSPISTGETDPAAVLLGYTRSENVPQPEEEDVPKILEAISFIPLRSLSTNIIGEAIEAWSKEVRQEPITEEIFKAVVNTAFILYDIRRLVSFEDLDLFIGKINTIASWTYSLKGIEHALIVYLTEKGVEPHVVNDLAGDIVYNLTLTEGGGYFV